ncbi:MAG: hypothetical protein ABI782_10425 [Anaerolineaceae bacterium]
MRLLCLYFPRLASAIARKGDDSLALRPVVLVSGVGAGAVVAGASVEAATTGVRAGMTAEAARQRCPGAAFVTENPSECLGVLEQAASILRLRATPNVAIVSGSHILVDLRGLDARFADEAVAATRLAAMVKTSSGVDVRAGVGGTPADARTAAESARRFPMIAAEAAGSEVRIASQNPARTISGSATLTPGADPKTVRSRVVRLLGQLELLASGREESFRRVRIEVERSEGIETAVLSAAQPLHTAAEALALLAAQETDGLFLGALAVRVSFERLGPDMRIETQMAAPVASRMLLQGPVRPIQQRLLRAG